MPPNLRDFIARDNAATRRAPSSRLNQQDIDTLDRIIAEISPYAGGTKQATPGNLDRVGAARQINSQRNAALVQQNAMSDEIANRNIAQQRLEGRRIETGTKYGLPGATRRQMELMTQFGDEEGKRRYAQEVAADRLKVSQMNNEQGFLEKRAVAEGAASMRPQMTDGMRNEVQRRSDIIAGGGGYDFSNVPATDVVNQSRIAEVEDMQRRRGALGRADARGVDPATMLAVENARRAPTETAAPSWVTTPIDQRLAHVRRINDPGLVDVGPPTPPVTITSQQRADTQRRAEAIASGGIPAPSTRVPGQTPTGTYFDGQKWVGRTQSYIPPSQAEVLDRQMAGMAASLPNAPGVESLAPRAMVKPQLTPYAKDVLATLPNRGPGVTAEQRPRLEELVARTDEAHRAGRTIPQQTAYDQQQQTIANTIAGQKAAVAGMEAQNRARDAATAAGVFTGLGGGTGGKATRTPEEQMKINESLSRLKREEKEFEDRLRSGRASVEALQKELDIDYKRITEFVPNPQKPGIYSSGFGKPDITAEEHAAMVEAYTKKKASLDDAAKKAPPTTTGVSPATTAPPSTVAPPAPKSSPTTTTPSPAATQPAASPATPAPATQPIARIRVVDENGRSGTISQSNLQAWLSANSRRRQL